MKQILRAPFGGYWVICEGCKLELPVGSYRRAQAHPSTCATCRHLRPKGKRNTNQKTEPPKG